MNANDQYATWLTDLLLPLARDRIELLGVDASGAFEFYRSRIASGRIFSDYEVRLVRSIVDSRLPIEEIHEIGCGWGQLVFLLAWNGYNTTGFEIDIKRYAGAEYLRRVLSEIDGERARRATVYNEFFPPLRRPDPTCSLVVSTNIVIGNPQFVEDQILRGLRRYRYAIIDIDRFCCERNADQRPSFLARVEQAGLKNLGLFCDAGNEGQYYLFEPSGADTVGGNRYQGV